MLSYPFGIVLEQMYLHSTNVYAVCMNTDILLHLSWLEFFRSAKICDASKSVLSQSTVCFLYICFFGHKSPPHQMIPIC